MATTMAGIRSAADASMSHEKQEVKGGGSGREGVGYVLVCDSVVVDKACSCVAAPVMSLGEMMAVALG